jgi:hypothetical protein
MFISSINGQGKRIIKLHFDGIEGQYDLQEQANPI